MIAASENGHTEVVLFLLHKHVNPNSTNDVSVHI